MILITMQSAAHYYTLLLKAADIVVKTMHNSTTYTLAILRIIGIIEA